MRKPEKNIQGQGKNMPVRLKTLKRVQMFVSFDYI